MKQNELVPIPFKILKKLDYKMFLDFKFIYYRNDNAIWIDTPSSINKYSYCASWIKECESIPYGQRGQFYIPKSCAPKLYGVFF